MKRIDRSHELLTRRSSCAFRFIFSLNCVIHNNCDNGEKEVYNGRIY